MDVLYQLADLFIQAIPTIVIVFLFYLFMRAAFFKPLARVMDEREKRTAGARLEAEQARAAAEEKVKAYEDAMKKARAAVYAEQDAERKVLLERRAEQVREARRNANEKVAAAKQQILQETAAARAQLESQTPELAREIVQNVFSAGAAR
jgi:F-type H+-transporting ATPase subunit b